MRHLSPLTSLLLVALAGLAAVLAPAPALAGFFPGDAIDGPSSDVRALGDLDLARDGTGALAYVKRLDGVDHVFVARFERGAFRAGERIDGGLAGAGSQPVLAAADGGRLVALFVSDATVYGVARTPGGGWSAPVALGAGGDPAVDLSINGTAFATFAAAGDVRVARLDRRTGAWQTLVQPADVDPARDAGTGSGRPRVAISADGVGVVTWGEGDRVYARKMFGATLSSAPQDLTPGVFDGRVPLRAELPDVEAEDDSSYAWVVFRQTFADGGSRILARRQRGTGFDPPVAVDAPGGEPVGEPRIDMNGRGVGLAATTGVASGQPMLATLRRDAFAMGARLFWPSVAAPAVAGAMAESGDGLLAAVLGGPGEAPIVRVRTVPQAGGAVEAVLSRPQLGPVTPQLGFDAAGDRAGGVVVAWVQGEADARAIVAGFFDRLPGTFAGYTSQRCCQGALPSLRWQPAFSLWGPVRYVVTIDGQVVGETTDTRLSLAAPLTGATHRWQVTAIDVRGQERRSRTRLLRLDDLAPLLSVGYRRAKRVVTLSVRARDALQPGHRTTGIRSIVVSWGDRTPGARGVAAARAHHRYRRPGAYPLEITATDAAGNVGRWTRIVRIP